MQEILAVVGAREFIQTALEQLGGYYTVLFGMMGIILVAGMIMESVPNTIILAPIMAPIAASIGVDPFHFAVVFLVGDAIGFITPPYGLNPYVASGIPVLPYFRIVRQVLPYPPALLCAWCLTPL